MNILKLSRGVLHGLTAVALLVGIIFLIMGLVGPRWLVVDDNVDRHEHGLWQNCEKNPSNKKMYCSIITDENDNDNIKGADHPHVKKAFEKNTLILLAVACATGVIAFVLALATSCVDCLKYRPALRWSGIVWAILHGITAILAVTAVVIYAFNAHLKENRHSFIAQRKVEQNLGRDFWYSVYGAIIVAVSLLFAIVSVVLMFLLSKGSYVYIRVPRDKAHLHMTAV